MTFRFSAQYAPFVKGIYVKTKKDSCRIFAGYFGRNLRKKEQTEEFSADHGSGVFECDSAGNLYFNAAGLTAVVARTSAGALNYTPVAKVNNLSATIEELKKEGLWFVCADMGGETMYNLDLKGPIGLVIGNEGDGVSRLVKEKCDFIASIPMKGDIDSLNASVAAGVLAYEIVRQRLQA